MFQFPSEKDKLLSTLGFALFCLNIFAFIALSVIYRDCLLAVARCLPSLESFYGSILRFQV